MTTKRHSRTWLPIPALLAALASAQAQTQTVLHNFSTFPNGANPLGTLARDSSGNLYGTTYQGGAANLGVVFELTASGRFKVLHSFAGGADGSGPCAGVALDSAGNVYGTAYQGGAANMGVVYEVNTSGQETVLHSFTGGADGSGPYAGVALDSDGNLYGTTYNGGAANAGVVYKVTPSGQETILYTFSGGNDGANPYAGVTLDASGNLYGTTYLGGAHFAGVLYKLSPSGQETVLYAFMEGVYAGGDFPQAGVILDSAGNLYGAAASTAYEFSAAGQYTALATWSITTNAGNASATLARDSAGNLYGTTDPTASPPSKTPYGTVFKVDTAGHFRILYAFPNSSKPDIFQVPVVSPGVVLDQKGNLYGATLYGGVSGMIYKVSAAGKESMLYSFSGAPGGTQPDSPPLISGRQIYGTTYSGGAANLGTVFKLDATGHETVLHAFQGGADGANPSAAPVAVDSAGNVYGTTKVGGAQNQGVVYKVDPAGNETVLYTFTGGADGGLPNGVAIDAAGNLYGSTFAGGSASQTEVQEGVVFKVDPAGNETVLYSFTGLSDGGEPGAGVTLDSAGNIYGTTIYGGLGGVIFRVSPTGQETVLYTFAGAADGYNPNSPLIRDPQGDLYGTTGSGGMGGGGGVLYKLDASRNYAVLHSFGQGPGGSGPTGVVRDPAGNLYGATWEGGSTGCFMGMGCGTVYEVDTAGNFSVLHTFTGGADGEGGAVGISQTRVLYGSSNAGTLTGGIIYRLALP